MNDKIKTIILVLVTAFALSLVFEHVGQSYGERDGLWTASEKRQVIALLEQISSNTSKGE